MPTQIIEYHDAATTASTSRFQPQLNVIKLSPNAVTTITITGAATKGHRLFSQQ